MMLTEAFKDNLKNIFANDYPGSDAFIESVIKPIFGEKFTPSNENILDTNQDMRNAAERSKIQAVVRIGTVSVGINHTEVFDITLDDSVLISRSRVNIQQLVRSLIPHYTNTFMIFHYNNCEDTKWRFSFLSKKDSNERSTTPKRYTYLFGKGENCRTAAERFFCLAKSPMTTKDMIDAFDVEKLNDDFFDEYKKIYGSFCGCLIGSYYEKGKGSREWKEKAYPEYDDKQLNDVFGNDKKAARDYIKKMMGRLVFLKFLEKKGWLGCRSEEELGNGDLNFLQECFNRSNYKADFLDRILEEMFKSLNQQDYETTNPELRDFYFPYLNGGLFESSNEDEADLKLPEAHFKQLFEMFNRFNFTVDESSPMDIEVGVDPEMLGHIFENLLEDNKDKGAFYTPKEIVQYMCQQSLIEYLKSHIENSGVDIETFVNDKNYNNEFISRHAERIEQLLADVKICDPAIGSGAFPMGLLQEILALKIQLHIAQDKDISDFNINDAKKQIIQNSIYGVDIEQGAVDIARLRFWLSLVVDEEHPLPLPNLDYKIMQGNSLLESFEGIDLSNFGTKVVTEINTMHDALFGTDVTKARIRQAMHEYFNTTDGDRKRLIREEIETHVKEYIKRTCTNRSDIVEKIDKIEPNNRPFFLWHVYFNDVFEQGGFDIVIGNPPYGAKLEKEQKRIYRKYYPESQFKIDTYSLFILLSNNLLKTKGFCIYIIPNTLLDNYFEEKVREKLLIDNSIVEINDLNDKVFGLVVVHSMIMSFRKEKMNMYNIKVNSSSELSGIYSLIPSEYFKNQNRYQFSIRNFSANQLLEKLNQNSIPLESVIDIRQAIKSGDDKKYLSTIRSNDTQKLILRGKDIGKYFTKAPGLYIYYGKHLACPRSSDIFEQPKILIREAGACIIATYDDNNFYIMSSLYNAIQKNEKFDLKYILSLINSSIFQYLMNLQTFEKTKGAFTKAKIYHYYDLPVKVIEDQQPFIDIVDKILEAKQNGPTEGTSTLEQEIDLMVYRLYGLTYDEVLIVDPNTSITRQEYEDNI